MRFHYLTPLAAIAAAFLLTASAPAMLYAQPAGSVPLSGTLVNGTDGGDTPAGVAVLLHIFGTAPDGEVATYETSTDASGAFRFDAAPAPDAGGSAAVVAVYGGTRYSRPVAAADFAAPITLTVYEPTQDVGVVNTAEQSIIIAGVDRADRRIAALQLFTLENRSDTTLVPDLSTVRMLEFSFLRFSLPPDASGLDVSTDLVGGEVIPVGTGLGITAPVPPGRHTVSFTYTTPYAGDTLAWRDNTLQGAESLRLLIPSELGNIGVGGLPPAPTLTLGDISYRVWRAAEIAPGAGVNLTLSGLPEPTLVTRLGNPLTEVRFWYAALPALVAAALAGLLGWGVIRRRPAVAAQSRLMSQRGWIILGVAALLLPLFALLGWAAAQQRGQSAGAGINPDFGQIAITTAPAADFALELPDGSRLQLSALRGKVVLVDFWASWCGPCRQESDVLNRAYAAYSEMPVEFVGVNIWDTPDAAASFLSEFAVAYPTGADADGDIALDYGVRGIPEKFFIDANGQVRHKYVGPMPENTLRAALDELLAEIDGNGGG